VLLTPYSRVGWVAGPGLEGGQVAVLHLHVMALSQIAIVSCIMILYLAPAGDSEHEGKTRGRIVR
jgi:hypothetical protein